MDLIKEGYLEKLREWDDINGYKEEIIDYFLQLKRINLYSQELAQFCIWIYSFEKAGIIRIEGLAPILDCELQNFNNVIESLYKYVHPEDLDIVKAAIKQVLEGKEYDIDFKVITSKGIEKYISGKSKVILNHNNEPIFSIGVFQDISKYRLIEKNLRAIGDNLAQAQRIAGLGSWKYEVDKDEFYCSEEIYRIYNTSVVDFDSSFEGVLNMIHPEDRAKVVNLMNMYKEGKPGYEEYRILQKDGTVKHVIARGDPMFDNHKRVTVIIGTLQDITEAKELQKAVEKKQEEIEKLHRLYEVLVEGSNDVFEIIAPDGTIKFVSSAVEKVLGQGVQERLGKKVYDFYKGSQREKLIAMVNKVLRNPGKDFQESLIFRHKDGKDIYLEVNLKNLITDPSVGGIVISFRDISNRILMEKELYYLTNYDDLTGLPNNIHYKRVLKEKCLEAKKSRKRFALLDLELNGLKYVDYSLGYEVSNRIIIKIVERLKSYLKEEAFLSRYSDEQFTVILDQFNSYSEFETKAAELIKLFSTPFSVEDYEFDISVNIGISIFPDDAQDVKTLRKSAKIALFRSKKEGRNNYKFYFAGLDVQAYKELLIRNDLHHAVSKGQLRTYYQPMVQLNNWDILAAEVLVRWQHPDWGLIPPNEFISIAEETGIIIQIGKWMLEEVCRNYKYWLSKGYSPIKISMNFSSVQFFEKDFVDNIINTINKFELNPNFLIVEITESIFMDKREKAIADIKALQEFGVQIALDDFGTGFSSLAYLNSFNIDILKLDASFIRRIMVDETSKVITKSIINMARDLRLKVVAEGVEDREQLECLKEFACYTGQGYIFSRPLSFENFNQIIAIGKCEPKA